MIDVRRDDVITLSRSRSQFAATLDRIIKGDVVDLGIHELQATQFDSPQWLSYRTLSLSTKISPSWISMALMSVRASKA